MGEEEKKYVFEALENDILFYVFGNQVRDMENKLRSMYGKSLCWQQYWSLSGNSNI